MTPRAIALSLALPSSVCAAEFPALYSVHGVAANDSLNLRSAPSANADILGTLGHDQSGVEVIAVDDSRNWAMIGLPEATAWASLHYLQRLSDTIWSSDAVALTCSGTEPFWSADLDAERQTLTYQFFDDPKDTYAVNWAKIPENNSGGTLGLSATSANGTAYATIASGLCSDGMSDRTYGLSISLFLVRDGDATGYQGCCTLVAD